MSIFAPFSPAFGSGQTLAPAASSAQAIIQGTPGGPKQVRFINTGANIAYVRTFSSAAASDKAAAGMATTADLAIPSGMSTTITRGQDHDRVAHISAAGTTLQMIQGDGW